jgi:hypothetical protein
MPRNELALYSFLRRFAHADAAPGRDGPQLCSGFVLSFAWSLSSAIAQFKGNAFCPASGLRCAHIFEFETLSARSAKTQLNGQSFQKYIQFPLLRSIPKKQIEKEIEEEGMLFIRNA